jgi:hypothetical protein
MNGVAAKQQPQRRLMELCNVMIREAALAGSPGPGAVKAALESRHPADGGIVFGELLPNPVRDCGPLNFAKSSRLYNDQERSERRSASGDRVGLGRSDLPKSTTLAWGTSPGCGFTFSTSAPRLRTILAAIVKHIVRYSFVPSSTKTTRLSRRSFRPFIPLPKPRFCSIDSAWV